MKFIGTFTKLYLKQKLFEENIQQFNERVNDESFRPQGSERTF